MNNYLGQFPIDIKDTRFANYTPTDWALEFNQAYGGIDGAHHKTWVLDQMSRILKGTPVIVEEARWAGDLVEYRYWTGEPSQAYLDWVLEIRGKYDEEEECYEYGYDEGIAP